MQLPKLKIEDKLILAATRLYPSDKDIKLIQELIKDITDWDYLVDSAIRNNVSSLLHKNFLLLPKPEIIPAHVTSALQQTYYKTLSQNIIIYRHFHNVISHFSAHGIAAIALKGIYLAAHIYKDIGLRQMSDLDLLIKKENIEKAANILIDNGYASFNLPLKRDFNQNKEYSFQKNGVLLELHQHIHPPYESFKVDINDYWQRAQKTVIENVETFVLSPEDLLQHLCLHFFIHLRAGKFSLMHLCDISELLNASRDTFNRPAFNERNKKYNCTDEVNIVLRLARQYMHLDAPDALTLQAEPNEQAFYEQRFINILQGNETSWTTADHKLNYLRKAKGIHSKAHYLLHELFPLKSFMLHYYKPKFPQLFFLFYPYRVFTLVLKMIMLFKKKK